MKAVYAQLSDYSHFGSLGVWNVHSIDPDDDRVIRWSDVPQWRNEDHFKTACGLSRELAIVPYRVQWRLCSDAPTVVGAGL